MGTAVLTGWTDVFALLILLAVLTLIGAALAVLEGDGLLTWLWGKLPHRTAVAPSAAHHEESHEHLRDQTRS